MSSTNAKEFWESQSSSLHRSDVPDFFRLKAMEHASLMTDSEREKECVDLGCGAGEILERFSEHANVAKGIDSSEKMLSIARETLKNTNIELSNIDIFKYLVDSREPVLITTNAINQYLNESNVNTVLDLFVKNQNLQSFFLFDCVDPLRYALVSHGMSYRVDKKQNTGGLKERLKTIYFALQRINIAFGLVAGKYNRFSIKLPGAGMGYGFKPRFWINAAAERDLQIEIVSSKFYEYRFHVVLRK